MKVDLDALPDEELSSWGMLHAARSRVLRPAQMSELHACVAELACRDEGFALRGGGNSYGDAALLAGGTVLDLSRLDRILDWNPDEGIAVVEPGVTFEDLWKRVLPDGYWPPVSPGTMKVTMGGAAAFDIHGKNHYCAGTFRDHVLSFELLTTEGETHFCSRDSEPELFRIVLGSGGLLGIITKLELKLKRIHSGRVFVKPLAIQSFEEMVEVFEREAPRFDYAVGWHDVLASGAKRGRGLIHLARMPGPDEDADGRAYFDPARHQLPARLFGIWPMKGLWPLLWLCLNKPGMRLINTLKFHAGARQARKPEYLEPLALFHFLLDQVPNWKKSYLPGGLIQFQSFVPKKEAAKTFGALADLARSQGFPPYLCVTKRHKETEALLPYARDGFSQALDMRVPPGREAAAERLCRMMEERVFSAGGALYMAKDAMLGPAGFRAFVDADRIEELRRHRAELDPRGLLKSDQARRLDLL